MSPTKLDELLHPIFDPKALQKAHEICHRDYLHLPVLQPARSCFLQMRLPNYKDSILGKN
ncbi:MAG: hypothetical protein U5K51_03390 [Flavobacteriaceae bacterium]|nr:hypothetical protein [Flavobacteriaceae bacterium]